MNQPFDPYAAPKAAVVGYAPTQAATAGNPIDFTATQVLKGTWAVLKARWNVVLPIVFVFGFAVALIAGVTMVPLFVGIAANAAKATATSATSLPDISPAAMVTASFGGLGIFAFMAVTLPGLQRANLNAVTNQPVPISLLWTEARFAPRYAGLILWAGLMCVLGVFTLYIFSIWWIVATLPVWYLIVDKDRGVFDGIREAKELTDGRRMSIFGAYILCLVLSMLLGLIPVLGLLLTIPLSFIQHLSPAWVYAATQGTLPPEYEGQN